MRQFWWLHSTFTSQLYQPHARISRNEQLQPHCNPHWSKCQIDASHWWLPTHWQCKILTWLSFWTWETHVFCCYYSSQPHVCHPAPFTILHSTWSWAHVSIKACLLLFTWNNQSWTYFQRNRRPPHVFRLQLGKQHHWPPFNYWLHLILWLSTNFLVFSEAACKGTYATHA